MEDLEKRESSERIGARLLGWWSGASGMYRSRWLNTRLSTSMGRSYSGPP